MHQYIKTLFLAVLFAACNNESTPTAAVTTAASTEPILSHKYWVSKPFNDALFAGRVVDTLSWLPCAELVFTHKDSLLMTACLSDAGKGGFKVLSPTTLEITFEGFDNQRFTARYDEKTGVLHLDAPAGSDDNGWPTEFVPQDDINVSNIDEITINLGRKRLAGQYTVLPAKGSMAVTSMMELRPDGTQTGLGDYDKYEPWPSGTGGTFIQEPSRNLMYLVKKGKEDDPTAAAWQVNGDTLRIWDTKNTAPEGDMPEYIITQLKGTYIKSK
jgi:hypothetical protein